MRMISPAGTRASSAIVSTITCHFSAMAAGMTGKGMSAKGRGCAWIVSDTVIFALLCSRRLALRLRSAAPITCFKARLKSFREERSNPAQDAASVAEPPDEQEIFNAEGAEVSLCAQRFR